MQLDNNSQTSVMETSKLLSSLNLDLARLDIERDSGSILNYDFEINSDKFLKIAEIDLANSNTHGLVNALSNAKRAIDCQTDKVLACFGLLSRRNFPQKMDLLRSMGIVAPRIVTKVVKARNYLEHEYIVPEQEQVEDAIDIANLFVISLDRALHFFPDHYILGTVVEGVYDDVNDPFMDKTISIRFDEENPRYILTGYIYHDPTIEPRKKRVEIGQSIIMPKDKGFVEIVKSSLEIERNVGDLVVSAKDISSLRVFSAPKQNPCPPTRR